MAALLRQAASEGIAPAYASRLLAILDRADPDAPELSPQPLVDPLTGRKVEVLRLVAAGLSNQEVAQELVIVVGTVRRDLNSLYSKLNVRSRTQAVARARELGLL